MTARASDAGADHVGRAGRRRSAALAALLAGWGAAACAASPKPAETPPGVVKVPAASFSFDGPRDAGEDPDGPVTHLGRTVLRSSHKMVVARVVSILPTPTATEVARIEEEELLWGPAEPDDRPYPVLCGAVGLSPRAGRRALFLLRLLPRGEYEAFEVAPLDDADGPARLQAFRKFLEIEALPDAAARRDALLVHLRAAVAAPDAWTRANAIREYAAFSKAFPGALRREDGPVLAAVVARVREPELRRLAERALDRVPQTQRPAPAGGAAATAAGLSAALAPFVERFENARKDPAARRRVVVEAAAQLDRGAEALVARALGDADASVREAAAAAAGGTGMAVAGPRLLAMAGSDESGPVRTTCVIALGHLRAVAAVETLAGIARSDPDRAREAMFALARIRDSTALAKLRDLGAEGAEDDRRLAEFLVSDDFVRQEKAMGATWMNDR